MFQQHTYRPTWQVTHCEVQVLDDPLPGHLPCGLNIGPYGLYVAVLLAAFVPFNSSASSYAGVLLVCVAIEELARLGLLRAHL